MRSLGLMLRLELFIKHFSGPELRSPEVFVFISSLRLEQREENTDLFVPSHRTEPS